MEKFGATVRALRVERGYSLRTFASMMGISPTYQSQIERGVVHPPGEERIAQMAELLGVPFEMLLDLSGRMPGVVKQAVARYPEEMRALMEQVVRLSPEGLARLIREAEGLATGE